MGNQEFFKPMANGWGGARPNSGRKYKLEEEKITALLKRSVELTIAYIENESVPLRDRAEVFSRLAGKAIPQDLNVSGEFSHNHFIQSLITKSRIDHAVAAN